MGQLLEEQMNQTLDAGKDQKLVYSAMDQKLEEAKIDQKLRNS